MAQISRLTVTQLIIARSYCGPSSDNLSIFSILKQIAQIPQNLLVARIKRFLKLKRALMNDDHSGGFNGIFARLGYHHHRCLITIHSGFNNSSDYFVSTSCLSGFKCCVSCHETE